MSIADTDLLPPEWRQEIQNNYIGFRDNMENVDNVITHLHQQRVITDSKKQQLDAMPTRSKKIDRLMIDVVLGFTVGSYKKFRQILRDTENTRLVSAIPDPDNPVSDDCKTAARALLPGRQVSDRGSDDSGEVVDLVHSESVSDNLYPSTPESVPDDQVPTSPETPPSRGNEAESRGRENAPPFPEYKGLEKYATKKKGLCVVFANFTGHLKGYNKDIENIKDVFFKKLKYKFYHYKNLTYNKTLEKLSGVKQILEELDEDDVPVYDRLAVFFLSHGDQDGIMFCKNDWGNEDSEEPGKRFTLQKIEECFNGENVPRLKGKPKFLVFQCCRGGEIVRTAARPDEQSRRQALVDDQGHLIPVDSDFLVSYACTPGNKAVVSDQTGSWFVKTMMDVFKAHEETLEETSVEDVLKMVNHHISRNRQQYSQEEERVLRQMPCYFCTLTKKFCLK